MRATILVLFLFLTLPSVAAVGFANLPTQREFLFVPGDRIDIPIYVVGDDRIDIALSTPNEMHPATLGTAQDDNILSYVTIDDPAPGTGPRQATLRIALPSQLRAGIHTIDVQAKERPPENLATVSAVASTRLRFTIRVLTPEKLVEVIGLFAPPIAQGLTANATVTIVSRTVQHIDNLVVSVNVYDNGSRIATSPVQIASLAPGATVGMLFVLPTQLVEGGEYPFNASVTYDGILAPSPQGTLKIGTLHVSIPTYTGELTYNTTNKFAFVIANEWNRELRDVYAIVHVQGQEKKTASQAIAAFGTTSYEIYFDRDPTLLPGSAIVNVTVSFRDYDPILNEYVDKEEEFSLPVVVSVPAIEERPAISLQLLLLSSIIGLLILLLIVVLFLLLRRKKEPATAQPRAPLQEPAAAQQPSQVESRAP